MRWLASHIRRPAAAVVLVALLMPVCWSSMLLADEQRLADPKLLPKFPAVQARDALNTFQIRKGFRLELVAAEPLVTEPIALAFDEDGRLFVVEMNDFPQGDEKYHGQIKRLEDTDGDGRFDKSTIFADHLRWPSAIHCYRGGVFVGAVPDLLYYKDTDDNGVADKKKVILDDGIDAGGRASGYFSAACGLTIYRGNAWPREYVGEEGC